MHQIRTLNFKIASQRVSQTSEQLASPPVCDSSCYLYAHFDCSSEWNELSKLAVFESQSGERFTVILDNNTCAVPNEILSAGGNFTVGLVGFGNGAYRLTTDTAAVTLDPACALIGETPSEPTPELYASLAEHIRSDKADNDAKFNALTQTIADTDARLDGIDAELDSVTDKLERKLDCTLDPKYSGKVIGVAQNGSLVPLDPKHAESGRCANALLKSLSGTQLSLDDVSPTEHELDITFTGRNSTTAKLTVSGSELLDTAKLSCLNNVFSARALSALGVLNFTGMTSLLADNGKSSHIACVVAPGVYENNHLQAAFRPLGYPIMSYPYIKLRYRTDSDSDIFDFSMRSKLGESWLLSMPECVGNMCDHEIIIDLNAMYGGAGVPSGSDETASLVIKPFGSQRMTFDTDKHFELTYIAAFKSYSEASSYSFDRDFKSYSAEQGIILNYSPEYNMLGISGTYCGSADTLSIPALESAQSELAGAGFPIMYTVAEDPANHLLALEGPDHYGIIRVKLSGLKNGEKLTVRFKPVVYKDPPAIYVPDAGGRVIGVKSLYPKMKLVTDIVTTINATYERDANKIINELAARLSALESKSKA